MSLSVSGLLMVTVMIFALLQIMVAGLPNNLELTPVIWGMSVNSSHRNSGFDAVVCYFVKLFCFVIISAVAA